MLSEENKKLLLSWNRLILDLSVLKENKEEVGWKHKGIIVKWLDDNMGFQPGFSSWDEIVTEFLMSDPSGWDYMHLSMRYKIKEKEAKDLLRILQAIKARL